MVARHSPAEDLTPLMVAPLLVVPHTLSGTAHHQPWSWPEASNSHPSARPLPGLMFKTSLHMLPNPTHPSACIRTGLLPSPTASPPLTPSSPSLSTNDKKPLPLRNNVTLAPYPRHYPTGILLTLLALLALITVRNFHRPSALLAHFRSKAHSSLACLLDASLRASLLLVQVHPWIPMINSITRGP